MITPRAKYPDRTEKFLTDVKVALETLEDEVGSLSEHTRSGAYKNFLESYRDALIPLWNPAHFASVKTVLETVANLQMTDLAVMARRLQPTTPSSTIVKEKKMTPDLETEAGPKRQVSGSKPTKQRSLCDDWERICKAEHSQQSLRRGCRTPC